MKTEYEPVDVICLFVLTADKTCDQAHLKYVTSVDITAVNDLTNTEVGTLNM